MIAKDRQQVLRLIPAPRSKSDEHARFLGYLSTTLLACRVSADLSVDEVSQAIGVARKSVEELESGQCSDLLLLYDYVKALEISLSEVLEVADSGSDALLCLEEIDDIDDW